MNRKLFLVFLFFGFSNSLFCQLERPKNKPKNNSPTSSSSTKPKTTQPTVPSAGAETNATVEILWTGQGAVKVKIGNNEFSLLGSSSTTIKFKAGELYTVTVIKPDKQYDYGDYITFANGKNYLTLSLEGGVLNVNAQTQEQLNNNNQNKIDKESNNDQEKLTQHKKYYDLDTIVNREEYIRWKWKVKTKTEWAFDKHGNKYKKNESCYDQNGICIGAKTWNEQNVLISSTKYYYDEKRKLTKFEITDNTNTISTYTYSYDENGRLINYANDKTFVGKYEYDSQGLVIRQINTDKNYSSISTLYYNDDKQNIRIETSGTASSTGVMQYDNRGNLIKMNFVTGDFKFYYTYNFDSKDLVVSSSTIYNSKYLDDAKAEFTYEFY